jgi:hypothetical protein
MSTKKNYMKNSKLLFNVILLFSLVISSVSCNRSHAPVYEKYLKFKNASWDRFDIKHFDLPIAEADKIIDITLVVRCTEQFKSDKLPVYAILTMPSGEESIREISVPVRENSKLITLPEGTKPESRIVLWENLNITKGNCKISIENLIPKIQTEGIDEVGIVVTESK